MISKKELLDFTGISYGQLYRWKRKGLIPEEWFLKRPAFTGQETFFPRGKILRRIEQIQDMKEDVPLDDLAEMFSPDASVLSLDAAELAARGVAPPPVTELYASFCGGEKDAYGFDDMVLLSVLAQLLDAGNLSRDEALEALSLLAEQLPNYPDGSCALCAARKLGVFGCFLVSLPCGLKLEKSLRQAAFLELPAVRAQLKQKLL